MDNNITSMTLLLTLWSLCIKHLLINAIYVCLCTQTNVSLDDKKTLNESGIIAVLGLVSQRWFIWDSPADNCQEHNTSCSTNGKVKGPHGKKRAHNLLY